MQLDDHLKQLLRELGHAINDTVSDSERIADAITSVRTAGFDIVLARRGATDDPRLTVQDRNFLESLHIRVDQEVAEEESQTKVEITPQDVKFLKSLKISLDEAV